MRNNLFKGTDYTFCSNHNCKVKDTCVRFIKHYNDNIADNAFLSMLSYTGNEKCQQYIKLEWRIQ